MSKRAFAVSTVHTAQNAGGKFNGCINLLSAAVIPGFYMGTINKQQCTRMGGATSANVISDALCSSVQCFKLCVALGPFLYLYTDRARASDVQLQESVLQQACKERRRRTIASRARSWVTTLADSVNALRVSS